MPPWLAPRLRRWPDRVMDHLSLSAARRIVDAALLEAEAQNVAVNIAVVDAGGNLVTHVRMDGAFFGSADIAINKAWTAAAFQMSSADLGAQCRPGAPAYGLENSNQGRVMIVGGGLPLVWENHIVGAIGVSGAAVEQDEAVAEAGAKALHAG